MYPAKGGEKQQFCNIPEHFVLLNKEGLPQEPILSELNLLRVLLDSN